jgi:hypothetical protein
LPGWRCRTRRRGGQRKRQDERSGDHRRVPGRVGWRVLEVLPELENRWLLQTSR